LRNFLKQGVALLENCARKKYIGPITKGCPEICAFTIMKEKCGRLFYETKFVTSPSQYISLKKSLEAVVIYFKYDIF